MIKFFQNLPYQWHFKIWETLSNIWRGNWPRQTLTADTSEALSGDTETQLNVLLDTLSEIEKKLTSLQDTKKNVSCKIISSIKNIMSNRHVVQNKFNSVFQICSAKYCWKLGCKEWRHSKQFY